MDRIFIKGLTVNTIIGIYSRERIERQRIILDMEMSADISKAARTEDIQSTLDYKVLSDSLVDFLEASNFQLIETMAERVTEIIRKDYGVQWVKLTLHKPDALTGDTDVGVIIERGARPDD